MRKSAKNGHLDGAQPNSKVYKILLNLLLLLLKDVDMHCSKTSGKPEKAKTKNFSENALVWSSYFVVLVYLRFFDLRISGLKRVQTWKSQFWHCKDPRSKISWGSWHRNLGSSKAPLGSKISVPRPWGSLGSTKKNLSDLRKAWDSRLTLAFQKDPRAHV